MRSEASTSTPLSTASPAGLRQRDVGGDADADDDRVGREHACRRRAGRRWPARRRPSIRRAWRRDAAATPCSACRSAKTCAISGPSTASSGSAAISTIVTVGAGLAGGGRDLEPDPAGADDDQPAPGAERRADRVGVGMSAQVQHVRARPRPAPASNRGTRAGGQQQLAVGQRRAVVERDGVRVAVERRGRRRQPQVDVVLGVPRQRLDERVGERVPRRRGSPSTAGAVRTGRRLRWRSA